MNGLASIRPLTFSTALGSGDEILIDESRSASVMTKRVPIGIVCVSPSAVVWTIRTPVQGISNPKRPSFVSNVILACL